MNVSSRQERTHRQVLLSLMSVVMALSLTACANDGGTLYEVAQRGENRNKAIRLIEGGAVVDEINGVSGWTPLHTAAANGHKMMCAVLLEYGADPNMQDRNGSTPLHAAMARKHTDTVGVLLSGGADPTIKNRLGQTAADVRQSRGDR
jgi:ankyrin repeat protein